jgi:hypothetical protein
MLPAYLIIHLIAESAALPVAAHADCFYRKPNGNIVLHQCRRPMKRKFKKLPPRKILVVPTGREVEI